ncbi:hypothetical protein FJZ53_06610 [Candidatus Woesearchaeota archaeon]|nr:hypothetical protein [Candidatus Woesearchaeota archaeon]
MNLKILKETDSPLLCRKVLNFEVEYSGSRTPKKEEVKKLIAVAQKVKEDLVVVKHVYPKFGEAKARIIAHVYNTLNDLQKYEPKKKSKSEAGEKKAEKPKEKADAKKES